MTHLAITFPGGYLREVDPHAAPLAVVIRRALEEAGAVVEPILYDDLLDTDAFERGVRRDVDRLLEAHQPQSVTFVAKSLGTKALGIVCATMQHPRTPGSSGSPGLEVGKGDFDP